MNIKLPGSTKTKTRLLIILIILSSGIILYEAVTNMKQKSINNDNVSVEETILSSSLNEEDNKEIEENNEKNEVNEISAEENSLYNEAYNLFFSNEYEKSINKSSEIISKYPNSYLGYNIRGIAKAYNGNYDEGIKDINKSLEINPDFGYARFNKGLANELYNNMDEALLWYNKALEIEDYVWTYYGIASIYGRNGDVKNTMKYLNKAIEIDSAVKEEAKTEKDFDPVRNSQEFIDAVNS